MSGGFNGLCILIIPGQLERYRVYMIVVSDALSINGFQYRVLLCQGRRY